MEFINSLDAKDVALILGVILGASFLSFKLVKSRSVNQNNNTIHGNGDIIGGNKTTKSKKR